jgi:hypothetical protein
MVERSRFALRDQLSEARAGDPRELDVYIKSVCERWREREVRVNERANPRVRVLIEKRDDLTRLSVRGTPARAQDI